MTGFFFKQKTAYERRMSDGSSRRVLFRSLSNGSLILSAEQVPAAFNAETIFGVEHLVYDGFNLLNAGGAPCAGSCRVRMDGPNKSVALTVRIIEGRLFLE